MLKKKNYRIYMGLALAAAIMMMVTPASAIEFTISGQVNRAGLYADDGSTAKWFFVDNINSSTRFRFRGSNDFDHGWRVGFLWEVEMKSNPSNKVAMDDDADLGPTNFNERHLEVWVEKWG